MNISMSIFRLQRIDRHSTFLTVLIEKGNQIRQPEYTFSWKRFHTQPYEYLLVFYEFSISRSSIFEPASHRISYPSFTHVPSSVCYCCLSFSLLSSSLFVHLRNVCANVCEGEIIVFIHLSIGIKWKLSARDYALTVWFMKYSSIERKFFDLL
jgi:hypothetical protein